MDEREALYSFKVEIIEDTEDLFQIDERTAEEQCGANATNFNKVDTPYIFMSDNNAPYHITLNHIVNQFGTNNADGVDQLTLYVYSDYLENPIRFPVFDIENDEMLYFDDVSIPCKSEVIFSLANEENLDMLDVHNTVRVNCNSMSLGTKEKIFRFYSLNLFFNDEEEEE